MVAQLTYGDTHGDIVAHENALGLDIWNDQSYSRRMSGMGRPREFDRQHALEAAMQVFWAQGYEGSSLGDLLAAMDLSRSSLYQSFGNKDALFRACLEEYSNALIGQMEASLAAAPSGRAFLSGLLASIAQTAGMPLGARGCLMVNTVSEFGPDATITGSALEDGLARVTGLFLRAIERAQREGDIDAGENPEDLAAYLHVAVSGLRTMIKAGASPRSINSTLERLLKAF